MTNLAVYTNARVYVTAKENSNVSKISTNINCITVATSTFYSAIPAGSAKEWHASDISLWITSRLSFFSTAVIHFLRWAVTTVKREFQWSLVSPIYLKYVFTSLFWFNDDWSYWETKRNADRHRNNTYNAFCKDKWRFIIMLTFRAFPFITLARNAGISWPSSLCHLIVRSSILFLLDQGAQVWRFPSVSNSDPE